MSEQLKSMQLLSDRITSLAAEAIVGCMTPELMQQVAEEILTDTVKRIDTKSTYSGLGKLINDKAEMAIKEYLQMEAVLQQIREAVRQGVQKAIAEMPEQVKGKVIDVALKGMCDALNKKQAFR